MKTRLERMSTRSDRMGTPSLFPCADKVKIPQLGSEDTGTSFDLKLKRYGRAPTNIVFKSGQLKQEPIPNHYLKKISTDISFDEDVVRERCFHMLPYDEKYLYEALSPGELVPAPPKMKIPPGRHNARKNDVRHMPCNLTATYKPQLKPLKRRIMDKAMQMCKDAIIKAELAETLQEERLQKQGVGSSVFLTELGQDVTQTKGEKKDPVIKKTKTPIEDKSKSESKAETRAKSESEDRSVFSPTKSTSDKKKYVEIPERPILTEKDYDWDGFVLSELSYNTASWLVYDKMPPSQEQEKFQIMMEGWYGKQDPTRLFKDELENKEKDEGKKPKKKWKKKEASLLAKAHLIEDSSPHAHDPYSDDNKAPFYRQPAGLRRIRKIEEKEDAGAINATADIVVKTYTPSPPPTIRDFVNPKVGDKLFDTDNKFEQEWLTGAQQVHELKGDQTRIYLDTNNKYKKQMQEGFPPAPEEWYPETDREKKEAKITPRMKKVTKGLKRWKALPKPADDSEENIVRPGYDPEYHRSPDPMTRRMTKQNQALTQVIDEWRSKWHLAGQLSDSTPEDLIKDMADIQSHVRLKAIATIAKAAEMQSVNKVDPYTYGQQENQFNFPLGAGKMPEKLLVALECLLEDTDQHVAIAAAITLYSLNRPCEQAKTILHDGLVSDNSVDRWASAQCLAHFGVCNSLVVGEVIRQLLITEDTIKHEKAIFLLGKLSIFSPLVHCMVAEQLNSSSWRHKVIACKILPTLSGTINKDITNKLSDLMWNDWHEDVRKSAAQCLGKTSHGREVHEDLRDRLINGDEMTRLEAINKIGQLGIMTAKLLPVFLKCFDDEYVSVRSEICITCGNLEIKDEQVLEKLVNMATFDNIWKVKALAIQAMGKIGVVTDEIIETLLWAVRYEENPGVRAEACHTLMVMELKTTDVAEVLQERFLVESSPVVREEIAKTLEMYGISATADMDMVAQIKKEVRKLCTRNNIAAEITTNENNADKQRNLARMIDQSTKELQRFFRRSNRYRVLKLKAEKKKDLHCHSAPSVRKFSYIKMCSWGHEPEKVPIMKDIKAGSQVSSRSSTPHPKIVVDAGTESPTPSREAAVFTPSADEELDKILSREDASSRTSPETSFSESLSTPAAKSQPQTPHDSEGGSPRPKSKMDKISEGEGSESAADNSAEGDADGLDSERDRDVDLESGSGRPGSVVKFASELHISDIPGRDRSSLALMSTADDKRVSRVSSMGLGSEVRAFSRDARLERDKIDREARDGFAGLDARYYEMIEELLDVDNTYELLTHEGKTIEQIQQQQEKIKNITFIQPSVRKDSIVTFSADESFIIEDDDLEEIPDSPEKDVTKSGSKVTSQSSGKVHPILQKSSETVTTVPKPSMGSVNMFPSKKAT